MHNLLNDFCGIMTNVFFILATKIGLNTPFLKNSGPPEYFLAPWPETLGLVPVTVKTHNMI